jgi:hypothetical protein
MTPTDVITRIHGSRQAGDGLPGDLLRLPMARRDPGRLAPQGSPAGAQTPEPTTIPAGEGLGRLKLRRLLRLRERLATAAVEHLAHDLPGADALWEALGRLEDQVQEHFPAVWRELYPQWVEQDAARLHTAANPSGTCRICTAGLTRVSDQAGRAS